MKLKKIILLSIAAVVSVSVAYSIYTIRRERIWSRISSENLVLNSDFEVLTELEKPLSWSEDSLGGWSVESDDPYEGEKSMRATVGWSWLWQDVPVRSKKAYRLRAYLRSDIKVPGETDYENAFLTLECIGWWKNQVLRRDYGIVNATPSWQLMERDIYAPPLTRKIRIKLAKRKGEGSVWFDKVELTEISSRLLVLNSDFEVLTELERPLSWSEDSLGGWSVESDDPYEGEKSMRATVGWSWLWQDVPVRSKRYYILRAYVRSDIVILEKKDYENTFLTLECLNHKYEIIKRDYGIVNATLLWKPLEGSVYAPEGTEKIRIKLAKRKGEGSVWFDKVEIIEKPPYMRFSFLRKALKDTPFFIFYLSVYLILLASLLRVILKRQN